MLTTFAENSPCPHYPSSSLQTDLDDFTKWWKGPSKCQALQIYFGKKYPQPGD